MLGTHHYERTPITELYRWFAGEAAPTSPTWATLCRWIADTPAVHDRLDALPGAKRQPNVFLGALRHLGAPLTPSDAFLAWLDEHWDAVAALIAARRTQTNEPGRCAVLAPVLASLPQPVALLEVGASAGLCLVPDRYRYRYDQPGDAADQAAAPLDAGPPLLTSRVTGEAPGHPDDLRVAFRAGLDAHPLHADDPEDARWLRSLVWPDETVREARLAASLAVVADDPPLILTGDAVADLDRLLALAPAGATPVVQHSATLAYLTREQRDTFVARVQASGAHWLSFEGPTVVTSLREAIAALPPEPRPHFVVALDGVVLGRCAAHGGWVDWVPR